MDILKADDTLQLNFSSQVRRTWEYPREEQLDLTWEVYVWETELKWQRLSRWTLRSVWWSIIVFYVTQKSICKLLTWHLSLLCCNVSITLTFQTMYNSLETLYLIDFYQPSSTFINLVLWRHLSNAFYCRNCSRIIRFTTRRDLRKEVVLPAHFQLKKWIPGKELWPSQCLRGGKWQRKPSFFTIFHYLLCVINCHGVGYTNTNILFFYFFFFFLSSFFLLFFFSFFCFFPFLQ